MTLKAEIKKEDLRIVQCWACGEMFVEGTHDMQGCENEQEREWHEIHDEELEDKASGNYFGYLSDHSDDKDY